MSDTQVAIAQPKPRASNALAAFIGMEPQMMLDTIKAQCFKGDPGRISDAQIAAFVSIAHDMKVNPLLPGMMYAYPTSGGGIVPMMGPDAVFKKLSEHPDIESWETVVYPENVEEAPLYAVTRIWRKNSEKPLSYTAVLSEWKINNNPNWNTRPRHMLGLRSLKQAARQIIHGIPFDEDERVIMGALDVTPAGEVAPEPQKRADPKPRSPRGAAKAAADAKEVIGEVVEEKPTKQQMSEAIQNTRSNIDGDASAPVKPAARICLLDNEEVTLEVVVGNVATLMANIAQADGSKKPTPSVLIDLGGDHYQGQAYHFGGATAASVARADGLETVITPLPLWSIGNIVKAKLVGKLNKAKGVVQTRVLEASVVTPAVVPDEF